MAKSETITEVELYGGRGVGSVIREASPNGEVVAHIHRRDATVADRLFRAGTITADQHQAAENFRVDFERGQMLGHYGSVKIEGRSGGGRQTMTEAVVQARQRVANAMVALGGYSAMTGKVVWYCVGEQDTLEGFASRIRWGRQSMNHHKASGLLIAGLERLTLHYGLVTQADIRSAEYRRGAADAYRRVLEIVADAADTEAGPAAKSLRRVHRTVSRIAKSAGRA